MKGDQPLSPARVDYDRIAPTYNRRFAADGQDGIAAALVSLASELSAQRVLEVGCGTARWLADLASVVPQLCGLDFSAGMLRQARLRRASLHLVRGDAGQLPFPDAAFDLVYCVNAIHHFDRPQAFISRARRLPRPGGALAVIGNDPHGRRDSWYVYHYFEGTYETDLERFPSRNALVDWMVEAGFTEIQWREVERIVDHKHGRQVFDDPFLEKTSCSQLALLSDQAYAAGLRRIETALKAAEARGEVLRFPVDMCMGVLVGQT